MKLFMAVLLVFCIACKQKDNTSLMAAGIKERVLTEQLQYPWEICWGADNSIWMTERGGRISRVDTGSGKVTPLLTIADVRAQGEGGLLGMALHPDFKTTPYVYVAYDYESNDGYKEKIVRYIFNGTSLHSAIVLLDNIEASGIHNGCRLLFGPDKKIYISTGDASHQSLPQDKSAINGKILRLNIDGSIPADNPIAGSPVWSFGHRNPQGLVFVGNQLFGSEHGPDSDDEINIIEKGRNYGWPEVKGFCNETSEQVFCRSNNVKEPIKAWSPTLAVSGMDYYHSTAISEWKNSLLLATLKAGRLVQLQLNDAHTAVISTKDFMTNNYGRLRDVCISPDGKVYVCTSNGNNDKIIVLSF